MKGSVDEQFQSGRVGLTDHEPRSYRCGVNEPSSTDVARERWAVGRLGLLTVIAVPVALGFETLLRVLLFPADFDDLRQALRPILEAPTYAMIGVTALVGVVSSFVRRRFDVPGATLRKRAQGTFVASSMAQIPAVATTFLWTFGAPILPVLLTIATSTAFVAWHVWGPRRDRAAGSDT